MTSTLNRPEALGPDRDALDQALRDLHQDVLTEPVPQTLLDAARRLDTLQQQSRSQWRGARLAAGLLLAFGVGWLARDQLALPQGAAMAKSGEAGEREFVRQAGFAHVVYMPEKRHPVEVAVAEQEHLVQWLSKRLGKPLRLPRLESQGFDLMGGRLLPGELGARAQFMFENAQGQRVTLYLGAIDRTDKAGATSATSSTSDTQATQFRFGQTAGVPSFYWSDQGFGYALSGQVDKATLTALANAVYQQIN